MTYLALATDYDGTLATDGIVDATTLAALQRWRDAGRKLILITGRRLDDFLHVFTHLDQFDWIVVENGAVLYNPQTQTEKLLTTPPPAEFVQQLSQRIQQAEQPQAVTGEFSKLVSDRGLEWLAVGRVIVATWTPHEVTAQDLIRELDLDLQIIMNKGAVMILPTGVDKALGLQAVLQELGLTPEAVVGVGDAENDTAFLKRCGYSVAVANALPPLQEQVDFVTQASRGAGVTELIDRLLS